MDDDFLNVLILNLYFLGNTFWWLNSYCLVMVALRLGSSGK